MQIYWSEFNKNWWEGKMSNCPFPNMPWNCTFTFFHTFYINVGTKFSPLKLWIKNKQKILIFHSLENINSTSKIAKFVNMISLLSFIEPSFGKLEGNWFFCLLNLWTKQRLGDLGEECKTYWEVVMKLWLDCLVIEYWNLHG